MERGRLLVVNLNELAKKWEIPVPVIVHFIVDCDMPMEEEQRSEWFSSHSDLILEEKQKAFENLLFPRKFRPEPSKTPA
jgi:hypothetical protein